MILGADGPRVIDFGLAGFKDKPGDITHTSGMLEPRWHGAEQAESPGPHRRRDVYALGAVLMFAMTGRYPYERPTVPRCCSPSPTPPPTRTCPASGEIKHLVAGMLAYHPEIRRRSPTSQPS